MKDLKHDRSKELSREEMAAVRGGIALPNPFKTPTWLYLEGWTPQWAVDAARAAGYDTADVRDYQAPSRP